MIGLHSPAKKGKKQGRTLEINYCLPFCMQEKGGELAITQRLVTKAIKKDTSFYIQDIITFRLTVQQNSNYNNMCKECYNYWINWSTCGIRVITFRNGFSNVSPNSEQVCFTLCLCPWERYKSIFSSLSYG